MEVPLVCGASMLGDEVLSTKVASSQDAGLDVRSDRVQILPC